MIEAGLSRMGILSDLRACLIIRDDRSAVPSG